VVYTGPGTSAEWVVEDPGVVGQGCGVVVSGALGQCPMPAYEPPVSFTGLGATPAGPGDWDELGLVNGGSVVSGPSPLAVGPNNTVTGFTVSSGATPLPGALAGAAHRLVTAATP
jgi:hypothetical protein